MEGGKKKMMFICYVNAEVQVRVQLTRSTRALPRWINITTSSCPRWEKLKRTLPNLFSSRQPQPGSPEARLWENGVSHTGQKGKSGYFGILRAELLPADTEVRWCLRTFCTVNDT